MGTAGYPQNLPGRPFIMDADFAGGRLSLTPNTPVTTSDVIEATLIHYTPHLSGLITLFDGVNWRPKFFEEMAIGVPVVADANHDVFIELASPDNLQMSLEEWTNDTTRSTPLVRQNGFLVLSGDTTKRYVGTFRTTSEEGETEDSETKRFVWNYYNRVARKLLKVEATASWIYATTDTWRQANAALANKVETITGLDEAWIDLSVTASWQHSVAGSIGALGIGIDSTTVNSADIQGVLGAAVAGRISSAQSNLRINPALGYHSFNWLEITDAATATFLGTHVSGSEDFGRSGLHGHVMG